MYIKILSIALMGVGSSELAFAETANIQTAAPVIHLEDNLDEKDKLGWCIDTQGRGFGERLHAHSCKPQGGDVQFQFEQETGLIRSVAYAEYCMAVAPNEQSTFALLACDAADSTQVFTHDSQTGWIRPAGDPTHCVAVGANSQSAGPFMSRELILSTCAETPEPLIRWVFKS